MKELWNTLRGHRTGFSVIIVAEAARGGVEALLHPLLLKELFDQAIMNSNFRRFLAFAVFYLLVGFALNLTGYWLSWWRKRFENAFVLSLEMELLDRTLDQDGRRMAKEGNASFGSCRNRSSRRADSDVGTPVPRPSAKWRASSRA